MHSFELPSATPRPPTVCLTAIFGKIGRKSLNHVQALKSNPVQCCETSGCNDNESTRWHLGFGSRQDNLPGVVSRERFEPVELPRPLAKSSSSFQLSGESGSSKESNSKSRSSKSSSSMSSSSSLSLSLSSSSRGMFGSPFKLFPTSISSASSAPSSLSSETPARGSALIVSAVSVLE